MLNAEYFESGNEQKFMDLLGDIPFGQSDFQNLHLQLKQDNGVRTFRQVLLEMNEKFKALKECQYRRRKFEITQRMLKRKRLFFFWSKDRQALIDVELEENNFKILQENKVLDDAIRSFNMYKKVYDSLEKPTREEYDAEEVEYWKRRAIQQAEEDMVSAGTISVGNIQLLKKLGFNPYEVKVDLQALLGTTTKQIIERRQQEQLEAGKNVAKDPKPE